ncbi:MAG TPA: phosphatidylglycerophosphatase A [Acetobacteraceae bacterium]|nr:phosphatidylglycerophosphatase A [Acetobacteraceae bacterium]
MRAAAVAIAAGLGLGRAPAAPGTVASAAAVLLGAVLLAWSPWALAAASVAATLGGIWAIRAAAAGDDPGWVVIDEVAGQWITLLALPRPAPLWLLAGFVLFRVLDIAKPGPVGWADRRHDPLGVMLDDVIAGAIGAALLLAARAIVA